MQNAQRDTTNFAIINSEISLLAGSLTTRQKWEKGERKCIIKKGDKNSEPVYDICRLQTADCRPQIADCKLKDTKNLPNKGDTIKNITSCESEKVAWEQGWYFCAKLYIGLISKMLLAQYSSPTRLFIDSSGISIIALILYSSLIIVNW